MRTTDKPLIMFMPHGCHSHQAARGKGLEQSGGKGLEQSGKVEMPCLVPPAYAAALDEVLGEPGCFRRVQ